MTGDWSAVKETIAKEWDKSVVPTLSAYIEVPNQTPHWDPEWATNGFMHKAMDIVVEWVKALPIKGLKYEVAEAEGRTPFLIVEVDGTEPTANTLLIYGHIDKQPPLLPWSEGLHPYKAVYRDGKLYGRGGADDGHAVFTALTALAAVQKHGLPHGRIVTIIESCEESGSGDLPYYLEHFKSRIGDVNLLICLDGGVMSYDKLWTDVTLRGLTAGVLSVQTMSEGMHSGLSGGVVPDTFRIARLLLDRIENSTTGEVKVPEAHSDIPEFAVKSMDDMRKVNFREQYAFLPGVCAEADDDAELALRNHWKPCLTVTGANLPETAKAGNVIRDKTTLRLSIRISPLADAEKVGCAVKKILEANPPYNAKVYFQPDTMNSGCAGPEFKPWLTNSMNEGSLIAFGKGFSTMGVGGTVPLIAMLLKQYPMAQIVMTGVLGPKSNAHGPNEFLHVPFAKGLTVCIARLIADHFNATPKLAK